MEALLILLALLFFLVLLFAAFKPKQGELLDVTPEQILRDAEAMCLYGHHRQAAELLELYCQRFPDNRRLHNKLLEIHQYLSMPAGTHSRVLGKH